MLVTEYAPEESVYNKSFLYTEVLISLSNYASTHFPHLLRLKGTTIFHFSINTGINYLIAFHILLNVLYQSIHCS